MFAMFWVDVPVRTRPRLPDPPNTLAGTPASLTNCETQQRRLCCRFSVFIRKMLSFHKCLFRFCPHRRPQNGRIKNRVRSGQKDPLGRPGTRVLPSASAGKVAASGQRFSGFLDFCGCFTFWNEKTPETVYRTDFRKIRAWDTLRVWFGFG